MGASVNKAAFTLVATIAAVMAGGMVPLLGIAIATTLFKNKFIIKEKTNRLIANWSFLFFVGILLKGK
ncbi:hypothetical protein LH401_10185 [Fusobacterium ulcerans]|nr:hypothetical protein [Fusobacterium ulcerans]